MVDVGRISEKSFANYVNRHSPQDLLGIMMKKMFCLFHGSAFNSLRTSFPKDLKTN
jgi:hypothetical protein